MNAGSSLEFSTAAMNPFTPEDVAAILRERGWLAEGRVSIFDFRVSEFQIWLERAAALLGPQAAEGAPDATAAREKLAELLGLVFRYDARAILDSPEAHAVLLRQGPREVIRELAHLVLDGSEVDSDRFKEIITALKKKTAQRGRGLFHPVRLALAGRAGEGELDRVILLLDAADGLPFAVAVKGTRQRMVEFCSALD